MATRKAFPLRLDPRLYDELRRWAADEFRSINGQIECILRGAVEERRRAVRGADDAHDRRPQRSRDPRDGGGASDTP
jgi:hypothetical protein